MFPLVLHVAPFISGGRIGQILSKDAMKTAKMIIDSAKDRVKFFCQEHKVSFTLSEHYAYP